MVLFFHGHVCGWVLFQVFERFLGERYPIKEIIIDFGLYLFGNFFPVLKTCLDHKDFIIKVRQ